MQRSLFTLATLAAALLAASPAASYTLRTNASGQPVVWNAREIAVQLDATAIPEVKGVAAAVHGSTPAVKACSMLLHSFLQAG